MWKTWFFIVLALFIQEPASTDAAIFQIRQLHLNLWLVNLIWLTASIIDIGVAYWLGKKLQTQFQDAKLVSWASVWANRIENFIGQRGERFALILLGVINFPYLNSFLASWLKIPFRNVFTLILIGDAIYWGIEWGINIGVRDFIIDPHLALYTIVGAGLVFSLFSKLILSKVLKNSKTE